MFSFLIFIHRVQMSSHVIPIHHLQRAVLSLNRGCQCFQHPWHSLLPTVFRLPLTPSCIPVVPQMSPIRAQAAFQILKSVQIFQQHPWLNSLPTSQQIIMPCSLPVSLHLHPSVNMVCHVLPSCSPFITVEPHCTDTCLIWTPHYCRQ